MKLYLCLFQNKGVDFYIRVVAFLRVYVNTVQIHINTLLLLCRIFILSLSCGMASEAHTADLLSGHATNVTYPIERKEKTIKRQGKLSELEC